MTPRRRVLVIVAVLAASAAAVVAGITLATRDSPAQPRARKSPPPFVFDRPTRLEAPIKAAFRAWPHGTLERMEELGKEHPRNPVVQFHLGLARLWSGYGTEAGAALRAAKRVGRDTPYEIRADNLLHPQYFGPGYPVFQSTTSNPLLRRGARLQTEGHQHSAARLYARAAREQPSNAEAQVAAAVGRFDMDDLAASFSRLGPLTRQFPRSQTVRFHLALMLAWTGQRSAAVTQFRLARSLGPHTPLGKEANAFLTRLEGAGTK